MLGSEEKIRVEMGMSSWTTRVCMLPSVWRIFISVEQVVSDVFDGRNWIFEGLLTEQALKESRAILNSK